MQDILLQKFFEADRWQYAIDKAIDKHIDKGELRALTSPETRIRLYQAIISDNYEIAPPHQVEIPKDDRTMRIVYVNENIDRVFLAIANDLFFEEFPEFIHPSCCSYIKGCGCGKIVQRLSKEIQKMNVPDIGIKADLTKFFDSVGIQYIDSLFDRMENKIGKSKVIDIVRKYYHTDLCFDVNGNLIEHYQSLKQGCSIASYLADAVLYNIDKAISDLDVYYVRYSDDLCIVGSEWKLGEKILKKMLGEMEMSLNPKKVEYLSYDKYFKFLGFSIMNGNISLSKNRIKSFQREISKRTIKLPRTTLTRAVNSVNNYLYVGDGQYSFSTSVLSIINVQHDIDELNEYVMDCLRAVKTQKKHVGGLGYVNDLPEGVIVRGTGKNVTANRNKTPKEIPGYLSLNCMRNALLTSREVYNTLVRTL